MKPNCTIVFLLGVLLWGGVANAVTVRINEVMASNRDTLADEDGDYEDWIELYNYGTEPVDLSGWGLSDSYGNPFKWTFPEGVTLWPGMHMLVWASGKDRYEPLAVDRALVSEGAEWRLSEIGGEAVPSSWVYADFNDIGWPQTRGPFGRGPDYAVAADFDADWSRVGYRRAFDYAPMGASSVNVRVRSNWGAVIYLNGEEVVRHLVSDADVVQPVPVDGLRLWVSSHTGVETRVQDGTNYVTQWTDLSGNGNHLVAPSESRQPVWMEEGWNEHGVVRFDGVGQSLVSPALATGDELTVFVVARPAGGMAWSRLFAKGANTGGFKIQRSGSTATGLMRLDTSGSGAFNQTRGIASVFNAEWKSLSLVATPANVRVLVDGDQMISHAYQWGNGIANSHPFVLFADYTGGWGFAAGDAAEVLMFDRALDEEEVALVEHYLTMKYWVSTEPPPVRTYGLDQSILIAGTNVVAVDLQRGDLGSESAYFDLEITEELPSFRLHVSYSISSAGEEVILTNSDGTRVDELPPTELIAGVTAGRIEGQGGDWFFFDQPTPGKANTGAAYDMVLPMPDFSHEAGFYNNPFRLILESPVPGAVILYTLDGSEPDFANVGSNSSYMQSYLYDGPIQIASRVGDSNVFSHIPTVMLKHASLPDWTPPEGEVFKGTVIRATAFRQGAIPSRSKTATYFVDEAMRYRYGNLPVVSLVSDYNNLFAPETGIYVPGVDPATQWDQNYFRDWRRDAHIEFFEPGEGLAFSGEFEIRNQGSSSPQYPQKGFHVTARGYLGSDPIEHRIFKGRAGRAGQLDEFRRFIIRAWGSAQNLRVMFADAYNQTLVAASTDMDIQDYRPAVVFINGEYWGLHELREANKNSWYYQSHYGIGRDDSGVDLLGGGADVDEGDAQHWLSLWSYINASNLADPHVYAHVSTLVDIDNFIEYMIHCSYLGKRDWPVQNEAKWRPRTPDGKWRWVQFDMDHGMSQYGAPEFDMIEHIVFGNGNWRGPHALLVRLLQSNDFEQRFVQTYLDWMNSHLNTDAEFAHYSAMAAELAPFYEEHKHRWSHAYDWELGIRYGSNIIARRKGIRLEQLRRAFDLGDPIEITLNTSPEQGRIRINTLMVDATTPGLASETPYPWSGVYVEDLPMRLEAVPESGYRLAGWRINGDSGFYSTDTVIELALNDDTVFEAVFEPFLLTVQPVGPVRLIEKNAVWMIDLETVFTGVNEGTFSFTASSSNTSVVFSSVSGSLLTLDPLLRGGTTIMVSADDGQNPPVETTFRVLVYPAAHVLENGPYQFSSWSADEPDGAYPINMLFLQSDRSDTLLDTGLDYAYSLAPGDYHANDQGTIGYPYNNTSRTRINGLGEGGIAFINTGQSRDLGAALLALDTRGVEAVPISWLAGTVLANNRIYALRLQYRVGIDGPFLDVLDDSESPVEYLRETTGHVQLMDPVLLPEAALDQDYVQLLWRYYWTDPDGTTGSRAQLRLDDILVTGDLPGAASQLAFGIQPVTPWQSGQPLLPFSVTATDENGIIDLEFSGLIELAVSGDGALSGTTGVAAGAGVALFTNVAIQGAGAYVLEATSTGVSPAVSDPVHIVAVTGLRVPQYIQGDPPDNNDRVPFVYRARIEGLHPGATYRYGNRMVVPGDPWNQNGAGNAVFVTGADTNWIRCTDSPRFRPGDLGSRHWTFATDAGGVYEGWFITEPTGNARFTPGHTVYPRILLNDGADGEAHHHYLTLSDPVEVMAFGTLPHEGTALQADAAGPARQFVLLYDTPDGLDRPLAGTVVEMTGSELDDRYATFYEKLEASAWGTIIPNQLADGVRRVEIRKLADGELFMASRFNDGLPGTIDSGTGTEPITATLRPSPVDYAAWQMINFDPAEQLDPTVSGPLADPDGSGMLNLLRFAFGLQRGESYAQFLPRALVGGEGPYFVHRRLTQEAVGITYDIELTSDLKDAEGWLAAAFDEFIHLRSVTPLEDGVTEQWIYQVDPSFPGPAIFIRLRVTPTDTY